jgi:Fe-S cluster assembly protein SufD
MSNGVKMTQLEEQTLTHLSNFSRFSRGNGQQRPWIDEVRRSAIERFEKVGFPSIKEEAWRFTNVAPITKTAFALGEGRLTESARQVAHHYSFGIEAAAELVFVNGRYQPELSRTQKLGPGVRVGSLEAAIEEDVPEIRRHLTRHARIESNPFVALNSGFLRDGAYVWIGRQVRVSGPIHLIFVSDAGSQATVSHPRVLIVADEGSDSQIVESYVGTKGERYFTNAVTEIVAARDSRIDHCRLQQESLEAFHVATMQVVQDEASNVISQAATLGGKLTRNDLNVILNGEYAESTLNGLVVIGGDQHVDNHTLLHHEKANCPSHELYKYVLDDRATGVFRGKIFVQQDAQKTNAKQNSKSLLLSDDARINAMPALEIYADDVKCTHGSTTGPVDEDMVFYLRTRGVGLDAARHLLTYAFAADITRRIKVVSVRRRLEDFMAAQHGLPQDLRITDLGSHDEAAR